MRERKRVVVFVQSFVLIALSMWVLGELYLLLTAVPIADPYKAHAVRVAASATFGARYHLVMLLASLVIASAIAFHWIGAVIGGVVAVGLSCVLNPSIFASVNLASLQAMAQKTQLPPSERRDIEPRPGQQMVLAAPITVQSRYGKATIPAGTPVTVLRQEGESIWINVLGGETTIVTRSFLQ